MLLNLIYFAGLCITIWKLSAIIISLLSKNKSNINIYKISLLILMPLLWMFRIIYSLINLLWIDYFAMTFFGDIPIVIFFIIFSVFYAYNKFGIKIVNNQNQHNLFKYCDYIFFVYSLLFIIIFIAF